MVHQIAKKIEAFIAFEKKFTEFKWSVRYSLWIWQVSLCYTYWHVEQIGLNVQNTEIKRNTHLEYDVHKNYRSTTSVRCVEFMVFTYLRGTQNIHNQYQWDFYDRSKLLCSLLELLVVMSVSFVYLDLARKPTENKCNSAQYYIWAMVFAYCLETILLNILNGDIIKNNVKAPVSKQ